MGAASATDLTLPLATEAAVLRKYSVRFMRLSSLADIHDGVPPERVWRALCSCLEGGVGPQSGVSVPKSVPGCQVQGSCEDAPGYNASSIQEGCASSDARRTESRSPGTHDESFPRVFRTRNSPAETEPASAAPSHPSPLQPRPCPLNRFDPVATPVLADVLQGGRGAFVHSTSEDGQ
jgi:hypothetical protein